MNRTQQSDVIQQTGTDVHVRGHGKNFKPLVAAGSWTICGFTYGKSQCACCGRPIWRVLKLQNQSHDVSKSFPEQIDIGIVCGPKVFTESCIGFYDDPAREWERQHQSWKDFINYTILCVKHDAMWKLVPTELRQAVDTFLQEGYKSQATSGGWWLVKDGKKRYLKSQRQVDVIPEPRVLFAASRGVLYAAKRQGIVPQHWELTCDWHTGEFTLNKDNIVT